MFLLSCTIWSYVFNRKFNFNPDFKKFIPFSMEDQKPAKRKKTSSEDQLTKKENKTKILKVIHLSKSPDDPPTKTKKRKLNSATTDDTKPKKKVKKDQKPKSEPKDLEIDLTAPAPPSKKVLRLQKKGKLIPPLRSNPQPPPTDSTHEDRKHLVKDIPRAEFGVWIGNLSYKSDVKVLRNWLVHGEHRVRDKDITRINLPLNVEGLSKGYYHRLSRGC